MKTQRTSLPVMLLPLMLAWTLIWLPNLRAESLQGVAFSGQVLDPQNLAIPGLEVYLRQQDTDFSWSALTDHEGRFRFVDLPFGVFVVTVQFPGFETYQSTQNMTRSISDFIIRLHIQSYTQEVVVTATIPEFATELTVRGQELEDQGTQDLAQFLRQEPGLSALRRGPINFEPTIRGLQENEVGMFVDGTRTFAAGPARMDSDISHVSPHIVQTVRAVKGPYALNWGAGTLSAIQIETFRPPFYDNGFEAHGRAGFNYAENAVSRDGYGTFWGGAMEVSVSTSFTIFGRETTIGLETTRSSRPISNPTISTGVLGSCSIRRPSWSTRAAIRNNTILTFQGGCWTPPTSSLDLSPGG